jgi:hypothetical protein
MTPRRSLALLILASAALRLALAAGLGVGNDEAYHALLAWNLDWGYFDHPPMLALIARAGLEIGGGALDPFWLRVGFVALFAGSTGLMFRLGARFGGERAGLVAAVLLNATAYYGLAAGTFALPDGPLLFFWLLTLDRLAAAIAAPERIVPWVAVGLAWGGAMLSKYSAALLPIGALGFLLTDPVRRRLLRTPGPYLSAAIGLAAFAPVIAWNAAHGWASFAFQGGRALGSTFRPLALLGAIAGQAAYLFPWVWIFLVIALVRAARRRDEADRFLLWQAIPPLLAFVGVACRREVLPHWSLVGLIPAFPLLGRDWADRRSTPRRLTILSALPVLVAGLVLAQARGACCPCRPTRRPSRSGWDAVVAELDRRGLLDGRDGFLFSSNWRDSGQLAFAADGRVPVRCYAPEAATTSTSGATRARPWVARGCSSWWSPARPSRPCMTAGSSGSNRLVPSRFPGRKAGAAGRPLSLLPSDPAFCGKINVSGTHRGGDDFRRGWPDPLEWGRRADRMPRNAAILSIDRDRERGLGQMSKVVGLYQILLRRSLEHFFPDATLEPMGDRSFIQIEPVVRTAISSSTTSPTAWPGAGVVPVAIPAHTGQPPPVQPGRASPDRSDRDAAGSSLPRAVRPRGHAPRGHVPLRGGGFCRRARPGRRRFGASSRGAGGPADRGAVHLREPPGLDRGPPAGDGPRPGVPGAREPARGPSVRRAPVGDQDPAPDVRRPADAPGRGPLGRPDLGRGHPDLGRPRDRRPAPAGALPPGLRPSCPGHPGRTATSRWSCPRRRRSRCSPTARRRSPTATLGGG